MQQECHTKTSLIHAINGPTENINNNNGIDDNANDNLSMRFISMVQYRKQPVLIGSPLDSMFGENERQPSKIMRLPQDGLRSCYKSKVILRIFGSTKIFFEIFKILRIFRIFRTFRTFRISN